MNPSLPARLSVLLVAIAALLASHQALAQMGAVTDHREISAGVDYLGASPFEISIPATPFENFDDSVHPEVNGTVEGYCEASSFQVSEFLSGGINFSGSTDGGWQVVPGGIYHALSLAHFGFRVDTCVNYQLHAWVLLGSLQGFNAGEVTLGSAVAAGTYQDVTDGVINVSGRLSPGEYYLEGRSSFTSSAEHTDGATYSAVLTCWQCPDPIVENHPRDLTVACGATAVFTVRPRPSAGTLTYQWRRNFVPLVDSGHVAGATGQMLSINNACTADSGYYDVVLSDGTIIEPSQLARLSISTVSGVETPSEGPSRAFSIHAAGPNPFSGQMSFRYNAAMPLHATIAIYNAAGARIHSLKQGMVSGPGIVTWDGDLDTGARAPAGIYFLRVEAGSIHESRKVVLVR